MKVIIAIDESPYSKYVIEEAASRVWSPESEFMVLNVVAVPTAGYWQDAGLSVDPVTEMSMLKRGQRLVDDAVAYLRPQLGFDCQISGHVVEGHAVDCIVETAQTWKADLVMVGNHVRNGVANLFMGSTATGVLQHSPCTVELVKAQPKHEGQRAEKRKASSQK